MVADLRSPYPYFGGKSSVVSMVWQRLGDVPNYVEPFFGSGAMLLQRPHWPFKGNRVETVNDLDGMIPNFWRAIQSDPDTVAEHADWPVSELDLHARHAWLVNQGRMEVERLREDPAFYDAKIAGWWVWGACQWIGSGWCERGTLRQLPHLGDSGRGIHRPSYQLPHLGNSGRGGLIEYFRGLSDRLRGVRVCCGDWSRVCGPTPTFKNGLTGVFLDPPYDQTQRDANIYAVETLVAGDVRKWCIDNGDNPLLRIALCGYAGEGHEELESLGWESVAWKARGGYGSQSDGEGRENATRERIWFSPHCLKVQHHQQLSLFESHQESSL